MTQPINFSDYYNDLYYSSFNGEGGVIGGYSASGTVSENDVSISGDTKITKNGIAIIGGYAGSGTVSDNTVTVSGNAEVTGGGSSYYPSEFSSIVIGGYLNAWNSESNGIVTGNTVTVSGSAKITPTTSYGYYNGSVAIIGGYIYGYQSTGEVSKNEVTVSGGNVIGGIIGGLGYGYKVSNTITGNSVSISGGEIQTLGNYDMYYGIGSVVGGYSSDWGVVLVVSIRT